jgi:chromate transporter
VRDNTLWSLLTVFVPFSLISIGGGSAVIPAIQHEAVMVHGWLTAAEFLDVFAISRASPGPGTMVATLIGWKAGGWLGAIIATIGIFLPSSVVCYLVMRAGNAHRDKKWHKAIREGLVPVGTGLLIAVVITIFRLSDGGVLAALIVTVATAIMLWTPKFPTLAILALGGATTALAHVLIQS